MKNKTQNKVHFTTACCTMFACILATTLISVSDSYAADVNVADYGDGSMSITNFNSAYAAATTGDTVKFELNGKATWAASATISKAITVDGNGTTLTAASALADGFFKITNFTSTEVIRITGFTLRSRAGDINTASRNIRIITNIDLTKLRIDHNNLHYGYESIEVQGSKGVIDNNTIYNARKGIAYSAGSRAQADASWADLSAGTGDALFIEANHFIQDANFTLAGAQESIGTTNGGKLTVRHNVFDYTETTAPNANQDPFMAHGSAGDYWQEYSAQRRGQSVIEFYNNTMRGNKINFLYMSRGGVNIVHDNEILGAVVNAPRIYLWEEEYTQTENWRTQRLEWPAEDQVHNSFFWDNKYNGSEYFNLPAHFVINPSNAFCTASETPVACCTGSGRGTCGTDGAYTNNLFIQLDRDYFMHAPQATGGKETFTGANGSSSTYPTDGDTYTTLGTMIFSPEGPNAYYPYTPYQYPHALTKYVGLMKPEGFRLATKM